MPNIKIFNRCIEINLYVFSLAISFLSIGGFGVYRIFIGNYPLAFIDFTLSFFLGYALIHALRNTFTDRHKYLLIVICMVGVIGVLFNTGVSGIYWAYPPITGAFFVIGLRKALPLNVFYIAIVLATISTNVVLPQFFSIFITLTLICAFGYAFSARTEHHSQECVKLADLDPLTNLKNRRSLNDQLIKEINYHEQGVQKSSLLILDLDHFKRINDVYGHTVGDNILVKFSKMLKKTVRETDQVYRYGGEEFIIIANNTRLINAGKLAEHIREATEKSILIDGKPITVSIGVAEVSKNDTDITWLHRADHALYRAKGENRNLVYLAHGNKNSCNYRAFLRENLNSSARKVECLS